MKHLDFDVIVVGGGHAGVEAALAAGRLGSRTAMITMSSASIGVMSCNPAIGGLGKGHLVREIDALDGVMGRAADLAGIQFRLLNRRKGPAVQGPRAQVDRGAYQRAIQTAIASSENVTVIEGEVADLEIIFGRVRSIKLASGEDIRCAVLIVTTGTFLGGVIHIGSENRPGGRMGELPSNRLADRFRDLELPMGRLKTGTPPRLNGRTIDWSVLDRQPGDSDPSLFSFLSKGPALRQIDCGITHTNEKTHEIIRANLGRSAMYGGHIGGVGPRYCPSIEDKVTRFADKNSHQVFLEPEGLDVDTIYPNGISTSLPHEVQVEYIHSMKGLEAAEILQPGYAIEYDFVNPQSLSRDLQMRNVAGLYLAGQINGTTGYEEAAAQGLVAGMNAALRVQERERIIFQRTDSYIGVLIDDLVARGVTEPYRMFTSRAEFRLSLRADNADQRLTPIGIRLGCVSQKRRERFEDKSAKLNAVRSVLASRAWSSTEAESVDIPAWSNGVRRTALALLSQHGIECSDIEKLHPEIADVEKEVLQAVHNEARYSSYIDRQTSDHEALARDEARVIPFDFDYARLAGVSAELRDKLQTVQPETLAHAGRIEGMTPTALVCILASLKSGVRRAS